AVTRNENFPFVACPSEAAVRQTMEYAPAANGWLIASDTPFCAMLVGGPSGIWAPAESSSWTLVNRGSGRSENQSEIVVGGVSSAAFAAGALLTRCACA